MRRYCKNVDIKNIDFIKRCIYLWMEGKLNRKDVQRFLSFYAGLTYQEIKERVDCEDYRFLAETVDRIAKDIRKRILNRKLNLPPIRFRRKYDQGSGKWRLIGIQKPIHQIFDYIAVEGCMEMFNAKIGPYQMASIPGRGQEKGMKTIYRWLQLDEKHTRYYIKADIRQCYPSIQHERIKALFARDLKNPELLWLVCELIDSFPEGLSIGSYFSQYACNYYLSYAYHYASEQLHRLRKKRNGQTERIRLVHHILFYADDILFLGSSEKDLVSGMEMLGDYLRDCLGLELKPDWKPETADYTDKAGNRKGRFIDMMGYRIYRDHITIRRGTFKRIRRSIIRARVRMENGKDIPLDMAHSISSRVGRVSHCDSFGFEQKYRLAQIRSRAGKVISCHDKILAEEKKRMKQDYENRQRALSNDAGNGAVQCPFGRDCGSVDAQEYPADHNGR